MNQNLLYKNGKVLSFADYGPKDGFPLLVQHGLIASIEGPALFGRLDDLGVRLICTARPGYGGSSPCEMQAFIEWAGIAGFLIDALALKKWDVFGISSGAPYAYALAAKFPARVRNIFILSGMPALYDDRVRSAWPYPLAENASMPEMQTLARTLFFSGLGSADLETPDIRDSIKNDCFGVAQDLKLRGMGWGFDLSTISAPVYMQHSRLDPSVPLLTARLTAALLPCSRLKEIDSDVHFSQALLDGFIDNVMSAVYRP